MMKLHRQRRNRGERNSSGTNPHSVSKAGKDRQAGDVAGRKRLIFSIGSKQKTQNIQKTIDFYAFNRYTNFW
jgi:hypothetical protein